jgi:hypothetical protein
MQLRSRGTGAYSIFDEMGQSRLFFILYGYEMLFL